MNAFLEATSKISSQGYTPDLDSEVLKLGNIRLYSLLMMLGMLCAILTVYWFWHREKYSFELFATVVIITLPSAIIGARLFFIFERIAAHDTAFLHSGDWYKVWQGGLSIQGGVVIATLADCIFLSFFRNKIDLRKAFSIILPTVFIGQAIGRWGNFSNHEVFGKVVDANDISIVWLPDFIKNHMWIFAPEIAGQGASITAYRAPLFLYESIANFFGYIVLVWILNRYNWLRPGTTGALYWVYYGLVRISMENLRQEAYAFYDVLSILYIIVGCLLVLFFELAPNRRYTMYRVEPYKNKTLNKILYFYVWEDSEQFRLKRAKNQQRRELLKQKEESLKINKATKN